MPSRANIGLLNITDANHQIKSSFEARSSCGMKNGVSGNRQPISQANPLHPIDTIFCSLSE
jgi:hypothetical protein